ncbi:hypothetical protein ACFWHG_19270 [Streptomyces microflavus]|uniref:hypothetical protein n=1 Tax=Streptomyces microflavus TaxID=1919 RepID=UPI0036697593
MTHPLHTTIRAQLLAEAEGQELPLTVVQVESLAATATTAALSTFDPANPKPLLSDEQIGVLVGLALGESVQMTGRRIRLSFHTVRTRRLSVYRALGVQTGSAAVAVAMTHGLLRIPTPSGRLPLPGQHHGGDA